MIYIFKRNGECDELILAIKRCRCPMWAVSSGLSGLRCAVAKTFFQSSAQVWASQTYPILPILRINLNLNHTVHPTSSSCSTSGHSSNEVFNREKDRAKEDIVLRLLRRARLFLVAMERRVKFGESWESGIMISWSHDNKINKTENKSIYSTYLLCLFLSEFVAGRFVWADGANW